MMSENLRILQIVLPVFLIIGAGYAMRRGGILTRHADQSLLAVVVKLFVPCLALDVIVGNESLLSPAHLILPPLFGFGSVVLGIGVAMLGAKLLARDPSVRRTFSATTGLQNYGYIPLPLSVALFDREVTGVLFAFNLGVEIALWTIVVATLVGRQSGRGWWRPLVSPPIIAVIAAIGLNLAGGDRWIPSSIDTAWHMLGQCAVPLGLLLTGAMLADFVTPHVLRSGWQTSTLALVVRLGVLPALLMAFALLAPLDHSLRAVIVIQAAMPCAVFPIALAKLHGGDMPTALRTVFATSLVGLITIPLWLSFGLRFL